MLCYRNLFGEVKTLLDTKCELFVFYSLTARTHLCVHCELYTSGIKKRENTKSKLMLSFMGNNHISNRNLSSLRAGTCVLSSATTLHEQLVLIWDKFKSGLVTLCPGQKAKTRTCLE